MFENAITFLNEQKTPIELALLNFMLESKLEVQSEQLDKIKYKAFDSTDKYTAGVFTDSDGPLLLVMGTPYTILEFCKFEKEEYEKIRKNIDMVAKMGQKLIAVAYKTNEENIVNKELNWAGFVGIDDNIRVNAKAILSSIQRSGISIKILTGDNRFTAEKVIKSLGIEIDDTEIVDGRRIDDISETDISESILFTNVTPQDKLKIVSTLKDQGEIVTMIGDGINDVLALRKADVAVSMGDASDVALEEGDLILLDNELDTILHTIEEGRLAFRNIQNIISYVLSNSFSEVIIIVLSFIFRLPFPFIIPQILWLHMICDGPLDFSLVFERNTDGIMHRSHEICTKKELVNHKTFIVVGLISAYIGILLFFIFKWIYSKTGDIDLARSVVFITSAISSIYYLYSFKDLKTPIWKTKGIFRNNFLNFAVLLSSFFAFLPLLLPMLRDVFKISNLNWNYFLVILGFQFSLLIWVEFVKLIINRHKA